MFSVHHGYGYGYHKREAEAEADAHGYAYEKVTKTICKKTPITEEVSKDFELCRPVPKEVCLFYSFSYISQNRHRHYLGMRRKGN